MTVQLEKDATNMTLLFVWRESLFSLKRVEMFDHNVHGFVLQLRDLRSMLAPKETRLNLSYLAWQNLKPPVGESKYNNEGYLKLSILLQARWGWTLKKGVLCITWLLLTDITWLIHKTIPASATCSNRRCYLIMLMIKWWRKGHKGTVKCNHVANKTRD